MPSLARTRSTAGEISVNGPRFTSARRGRRRHGIGYLSEDRKRFGLALGMDVEANIVMATLSVSWALGLVIISAKTRKTAEKYVGMLSIKTPSLDQLLKNLSGGNQQKVVIGKWLRPRLRHPDLRRADPAASTWGPRAKSTSS